MIVIITIDHIVMIVNYYYIFNFTAIITIIIIFVSRNFILFTMEREKALQTLTRSLLFVSSFGMFYASRARG